MSISEIRPIPTEAQPFPSPQTPPNLDLNNRIGAIRRHVLKALSNFRQVHQQLLRTKTPEFKHLFIKNSSNEGQPFDISTFQRLPRIVQANNIILLKTKGLANFHPETSFKAPISTLDTLQELIASAIKINKVIIEDVIGLDSSLIPLLVPNDLQGCADFYFRNVIQPSFSEPLNHLEFLRDSVDELTARERSSKSQAALDSALLQFQKIQDSSPGDRALFAAFATVSNSFLRYGKDSFKGYDNDYMLLSVLANCIPPLSRSLLAKESDPLMANELLLNLLKLEEASEFPDRSSFTSLSLQKLNYLQKLLVHFRVINLFTKAEFQEKITKHLMKKIANKIHLLSPGESLLLPSGWEKIDVKNERFTASLPGHMMFLQVCKDADRRNFNVRLINTEASPFFMKKGQAHETSDPRKFFSTIFTLSTSKLSQYLETILLFNVPGLIPQLSSTPPQEHNAILALENTRLRIQDEITKIGELSIRKQESYIEIEEQSGPSCAVSAYLEYLKVLRHELYAQNAARSILEAEKTPENLVEDHQHFVLRFKNHIKKRLQKSVAIKDRIREPNQMDRSFQSLFNSVLPVLDRYSPYTERSTPPNVLPSFKSHRFTPRRRNRAAGPQRGKKNYYSH